MNLKFLTLTLATSFTLSFNGMAQSTEIIQMTDNEHMEIVYNSNNMRDSVTTFYKGEIGSRFIQVSQKIKNKYKISLGSDLIADADLEDSLNNVDFLSSEFSVNENKKLRAVGSKVYNLLLSQPTIRVNNMRVFKETLKQLDLLTLDLKNSINNLEEKYGREEVSSLELKKFCSIVSADFNYGICELFVYNMKNLYTSHSGRMNNEAFSIISNLVDSFSNGDPRRATLLKLYFSFQDQTTGAIDQLGFEFSSSFYDAIRQ